MVSGKSDVKEADGVEYTIHIPRSLAGQTALLLPRAAARDRLARSWPGFLLLDSVHAHFPSLLNIVVRCLLRIERGLELVEIAS